MNINGNDRSELTNIPNHQRETMDSRIKEKTDILLAKTYKLVNLYREFHEFSRKQIKEYEILFDTYDRSGDGLLELNELKYIMEKLGVPQTHLDLKKLITEVDGDNDNKITFPEFLLIYRNVKSYELVTDSELIQLTPLPPEIDVDQVGVSGAKNYFETKIKQQNNRQDSEDQRR